MSPLPPIYHRAGQATPLPLPLGAESALPQKGPPLRPPPRAQLHPFPSARLNVHVPVDRNTPCLGIQTYVRDSPLVLAIPPLPPTASRASASPARRIVFPRTCDGQRSQRKGPLNSRARRARACRGHLACATATLLRAADTGLKQG